MDGSDPAAAKAALRHRLRAARAALDPARVAADGERLAAVALADPVVAAAGTVAAYVGIGAEPDTGPLLRALHRRGVPVLLPVLRPDRGLDWGRYAGDTALVTGAHGLREPAPPHVDTVAAADVLLVPALAVDRAGHRLGRGAGCYDRVLAGATGSAVAVVHPGEVLDAVPTEAHDVPVAGVLTADGLRWWRAPG